MSKYNEKLATQSFVKNSINNLMKTINNPDEATEAGIYKVVDDAYILIVQVKSDDSLPIRQTKLTSDGMTYSREFNKSDPPYPEFTQSTVSQEEMISLKKELGKKTYIETVVVQHKYDSTNPTAYHWRKIATMGQSEVHAKIFVSSELGTPSNLSGVLDLNYLPGVDAPEASLRWDSLSDTENFSDSVKLVQNTFINDMGWSYYSVDLYLRTVDKDGISVGNITVSGLVDKGTMEFSEDVADSINQYDLIVSLYENKEVSQLKQELEKSRIINTAEGESIAIPDSVDAQLKGLKVMGKTEQFKTNGYQLFDVKSMNFSTQNGIAVNKLDNGSIRLTKTKLGGHLYASGVILNLAEFVGKTLYISAYAKASTEVTEGKNQITISYGNSTTGATKSMKGASCVPSRTSTKLSITITPTTNDLENYDTIRLVLYENAVAEAVGSVGDYVDYSDIMISTVDVAYEPYTGGVPAPNVNYPQPLNNIGDDGSVDVNVYGKNLFNPSGITAGNAYSTKDASTIVYEPLITNNYGTTINSTTYNGNKIIVTQSGIGDSNNLDSYKNGYFMIALYNNILKFNGEYTLVADIKITNNQNTSDVIKAGTHNADFRGCTINNGKLYYKFTFKQHTQYPLRRFIEFRCRGISFELSNIMIVEGNAIGTLPQYEPFKPIQTLTIPTPNGLPGVPVSSDGNYTDASGQQWVCDEIDFDSGVYIKRVYTYEITGEEPWKLHSELSEGIWRYDTFIDKPINAGEANKVDICMCTHYKHKANMNDGSEGCWITTTTKDNRPVVGIRIATALPQIDDLTQVLKEQYASGNPVTIKYILAEPIETPLSEAEINAYKELHTHYPNTSIHNSDNAHMAVDYVADTKNYTDNKIKKEVAELKALILEV